MATAVPRTHLVREILALFPENDLRLHFNIVYSQNLEARLATFEKSRLEAFLRSTDEGRTRLNQLEERYPQHMPGTFFLVKVVRREYTTEIFRNVENLAQAGRESGLDNANRSVRTIYIDREGIVIPEFNLIEIPLVYEQKLEYSIGNPPDSDKYGEIEQTYSLERAFVWLIDNSSHGLICCSGLAGLKAIVDYVYSHLGVQLSIPNMTLDIFSRLVQEGEPSSATFRGFPANVPTISVHAAGVAETEIYRELTEDGEREQIAGFFRGNDNAIFASFGISRKYARIWTPWKYSKPFIMSAATQIISRTEEELSKELNDNVKSYVQYFSEVLVEIDGKAVKGAPRKIFQTLIEWIVRAIRTPNNELHIDNNALIELVKHKKQLNLEIALHFDCENCGGGLSRCPECLQPYEVRNGNDILYVSCPKCKRDAIDNQQVVCECGTEVEFAVLENHIIVFPGLSLQHVINKFIDEQLDEVNWHGTFIIDGLLFRSLPTHPQKDIPGILRLVDLNAWRRHAHIHQLHPKESLQPIVNFTKEKCRRNEEPPDQRKCDVCLSGQITAKQIETRGEVCSPRVLGIAIDQLFDGIHHGHEVADIRYQDELVNGNIQLNIGIHLKSHQQPRAEGLGRTVYAIKSLYTQVFYSAYQALMDQEINFDVIGISIPNTVHPEVIDSMQSLLNQLGFSLLVVDNDDWLKIFGAVLENIAFQQESIPLFIE